MRSPGPDRVNTLLTSSWLTALLSRLRAGLQRETEPSILQSNSNTPSLISDSCSSLTTSSQRSQTRATLSGATDITSSMQSEIFPLSGHENNAEKDPTGKGAHDPGAKLDAGKPDWSLLPWEVIEGVVAVLTHGATKYSPGGWKEVERAKERYLSALMRHWRKMDKGEYIDPDSNLPHCWEFVTNAIFLAYFEMQESNNNNAEDTSEGITEAQLRTYKSYQDALYRHRNRARNGSDLGAENALRSDLSSNG